MTRYKIVEKNFIFVPYNGDNGKEVARRLLWEYLRDNNLIAETIENRSDGISAEVVVRTEEKEI